jgi:hypothetical protein
MAAPVYSAGTPGNLINGVSVVHGAAAVAAYLDLSTTIEGQVTCEVVTPSTAPTTPTVFSVYKAYAAGTPAPIQFTASAASGATTISVGSKAGLSSSTGGQTVLLQKAGTPPQLGELAKVTAVSGSSSPYTLTLSSGIINGYSIGDGLYTMAQTPTFMIMPSNISATYTNSTDYSAEIFLGPGQWVVAALNSDASYNVTANVTVDKVTSFV